MARRGINFNSKAARIWEWIFPTLLIAVSPVLAQYLLVFFNWGLTDYSMKDFMSYISPHGELLLVAVALVAESSSDVWRRQIAGWQRNLLAGICITFVIIASLVFAGLNVTQTNAIAISINSVRAFWFGIGLCIACKLAGRS